MKAKFKTLAALACTALCALPLTACKETVGKSTVLGKPAAATSLSYEERKNAQFTEFKSAVENFSASFAEYAYAAYDKDENFAVSPVSVYMALSLAAECAQGETRSQLLNALGVSYQQLTANFSLLYRALAFEDSENGKISGILAPTNSIWVNEGTTVRQSCIDALSNYYYCHSYSADFANANASANKAVQEFVKEQTRGLIDQDFKLSEYTLFALINTLYLKDIWNGYGNDLHLTDKRYDFKNADGTRTQTRLLQGYYRFGRAYRTEKYSTFFARTEHGYKIKFILPNDGYSVDEVFTAENIAAVNALQDYNGVDEQNKIRYYTRCLFPEYECSYNKDVKDILREKFGVTDFFSWEKCDLTGIVYEESCCTMVQHVTKLKVDRKGIEGAAVTVIGVDGSSAGPDEYEEVYEDFTVDRAFGFVLTDYDDTTLFSGVVKAI